MKLCKRVSVNSVLVFILSFILFLPLSCVNSFGIGGPLFYSSDDIKIPNRVFSLADDLSEFLKIDLVFENVSRVGVEWFCIPAGKTEKKLVETHNHDVSGLNSLKDSLDIGFYENGVYFCRVTLNNDSYSEAFTSNRVPVLVDFAGTGLPVISLETSKGQEILSKTDRITADFLLLDRDSSRLSLKDIKIKGRGNSTLYQRKQSYTLNLNERKSLLGMPENDSWVLNAAYLDKALIRNNYASYLGNSVFNSMLWTPNCKPCVLVLNGHYQGIYYLFEHIKIDENRVNLSASSDGELPFIFQIDFRRNGDFNFETERGTPVTVSNTNFEEFTKDKKRYCVDTVQRIEDVIYGEKFADPDEGYPSVLDRDSFVDWYLINEFTRNTDSNWHASVYLTYNPSDRKIYMGPIWDFDLSCGNSSDSSISAVDVKNSGWFERLFMDPAFVAMVKNRWNEKKSLLFSSFSNKIDELISSIAEDVDSNFTKWPILGSGIYPFTPGYEYRGEYTDEISYLKNWLLKRYDFFDSFINSL